MFCESCNTSIVNCDCPNLQDRVESLHDAKPPCIFYPQLYAEFVLCMQRRLNKVFSDFDFANMNSQN